MATASAGSQNANAANVNVSTARQARVSESTDRASGRQVARDVQGFAQRLMYNVFKKAIDRHGDSGRKQRESITKAGGAG